MLFFFGGHIQLSIMERLLTDKFVLVQLLNLLHMALFVYGLLYYKDWKL